jgi:hypothetical protein
MLLNPVPVPSGTVRLVINAPMIKPAIYFSVLFAFAQIETPRALDATNSDWRRREERKRNSGKLLQLVLGWGLVAGTTQGAL